MDIKKSFIILMLIFKSSVCLSKQSTIDVAQWLFFNTTVSLSMVDQSKLDYLFKRITIACSKDQSDEEIILNYLISECDTKISYYSCLINGKENNHKKVFFKLGLPILIGIIFYIINEIDNSNVDTRRRELIKKRLQSLGASMIFDGFGTASVWYAKDNCNEIEIKNETQQLADLTKYDLHYSPTTNNLCLSMMTLGLGLSGINDLLDQVFAPFYLKKYYFIKDAIQKRVTTIDIDIKAR
jgi:hypothetical protein